MSNRPRIAFLVNGGRSSAMAERAMAFSQRLRDQFDICLLFRESGTARSIVGMIARLSQFDPDCCYVFDLAAAGTMAAGIYGSTTRTPFVVDTGDDIVALGRVLGRGPIGRTLTKALERFAFGSAHSIVVRGSYHQKLLVERRIRAAFIPDGVDVNQFARNSGDRIDSHQNATSTERTALTIGLVGSSVWVASRQSCYGWELVEMVRLLRDRLPALRVRGVLIGDGSGIEVLEKRCEQYGIEDRIEFPGRVPYEKLADWLERFDICLSTQTDDAIGRVRTTGKLPLYLAAGRFVLASRVGEAANVLPAEMLVEFRGSIDPDYPARLAARVEELLARGTNFAYRPDCVAIAREHFEYDVLAPRLAAVLRAAIEDLR